MRWYYGRRTYSGEIKVVADPATATHRRASLWHGDWAPITGPGTAHRHEGWLHIPVTIETDHDGDPAWLFGQMLGHVSSSQAPQMLVAKATMIDGHEAQIAQDGRDLVLFTQDGPT